MAVTAVEGTRRKRASEPGPNPYNHHAIISLPEGTRFNSADALDRFFEAGKVLLAHVNADTGMLIYHPFRIKKEYRGDVLGHESGEGDMHWRDILALVESDDWDWEEVREEFLVFAPHLHVFAVTEFFQGGAVTREIEEQTGVVIERIADEDGVSLGDLDDLCAAVAYSLSHAGLSYNEEEDAYRAAYRYFGETANIERRANVRSDVKESMRRVSMDVLGVDFSDSSCKKEVSSEKDTNGESEIPLAVRALRPDSNADSGSTGSGSPMGSGSHSEFGFTSESGSDSGSEWSGGNTGGFATDMSNPDARGSCARDTASADSGGHDHADSEGEMCGGNLLPIWTAEESLADDEWREKIGEEAAEELEAAFEEWCELGEPTPETLLPEESSPDKPPPD